MALSPSAKDPKPIPVAATTFQEYGAKTSADGKWIAFASDDTGQAQIYIQPFPGPGERKRVSSVFGIHPRWRADARELFYWQPPFGLMSVGLNYGWAGMQASTPKTVLPPHIAILDLVDSRHHHAISGDGQRFLLGQRSAPRTSPINIIVNWTEALTK
jgi:eukaryotic-like serine/threonine-protein kinase